MLPYLKNWAGMAKQKLKNKILAPEEPAEASLSDSSSKQHPAPSAPALPDDVEASYVKVRRSSSCLRKEHAHFQFHCC